MRAIGSYWGVTLRNLKLTVLSIQEIEAAIGVGTDAIATKLAKGELPLVGTQLILKLALMDGGATESEALKMIGAHVRPGRVLVYNRYAQAVLDAVLGDWEAARDEVNDAIEGKPPRPEAGRDETPSTSSAAEE